MSFDIRHLMYNSRNDGSNNRRFFNFLIYFSVIFLFSCFLSSFSWAKATEKQLAIVDSLQVQSDAQSTTLRFIVSADVAVEAAVLDQPQRIILEWPDVNFQLAPDSLPKGVGVVKSLRAGMVSHERSRVVIELSEPALPLKIRSEPVYSGAAREIIVELVPSGRAKFEEAVSKRREQAARRDQGSPESAAGDPVDQRPLIVIDPGHGGPDLGATGVTGIFEKDIVLS
ncbi:MAG: hypothetical protein RI997_1080, partial [Pseudomonadota bacterium]